MTQLNPHNTLQAFGYSPDTSGVTRSVASAPSYKWDRVITTIGTIAFVVALIALDRKQKRSKRIF